MHRRQGGGRWEPAFIEHLQYARSGLTLDKHQNTGTPVVMKI
jgi:hypothetical protein